MNFDDEDKLELQHLAGGSIKTHAPVFSAKGRFMFVRCGLKVQVYASATGEITRVLTGATESLISLELEPNDTEILVGCTSTAELLRWHWRTGVLQKTTKINLDNGQVMTCNFLDLYYASGLACVFITVKHKAGEKINWYVIDSSTGNIVTVKCGLHLKVRTPQVAASRGQFKYIVLIQGIYAYFVNYKNWTMTRYKSANSVPFTCVRFCPAEATVATGDNKGCVFLWRQFGIKEKVINTLLHWHHTAVTSLAFTPTGSTLYSSGHEAVLVKWTLARPKELQFLPRMSSVIRHVVVSDGNEHIAVCTDDNAVHFVGAGDNNLTRSLQHFTYGTDDKTGQSLFPAGLRINPRTNTLVLNGRTGHLQFYSAYTKSLLYNVRIVQENVPSLESERIVYKTNVTRAAFNIDWMATGEVYNDHENPAECRLKFWQFDERIQNYTLNTIIELPHEQGFKAIVFSNNFQVDNLVCATVGDDYVIKLWSIVDSENIYKGGDMWSCYAQTSYKNYPIESVCFSQDGSILAAGYGNTLCIYDSSSLRLLHALSCPPGYDGVVAKAQLSLPKTTPNGTRNELTEQRQKLFALLRTLVTSDDKKLIEEARQLIAAAPSSQLKSLHAPDNNSKSKVCAYIMKMPELNLHHKLQLLRRFGIECTANKQGLQQLTAHLQKSVVYPATARRQTKSLNERLQRLHVRHRFKAKQRLGQFRTRSQQYVEVVKEELMPLFSMLQLDTQTQPAKRKSASAPELETKVVEPLQTLAKIYHVQFGAGAQAHLVTVCTESRVLIWNLMTLRLQAGLKLSVKQMCFDPMTNLLAVVTRSDELHVFQPNVPLPVYQRKNMPKLHGLTWLPRRQPKQSSINVDWQAQSTLQMLTQDQEIVYLAPPGVEATEDALAPISFTQPATAEQMQFATFGVYMGNKQQTRDTKQSSGPLIVGRGKNNVVNELTNLSAHTMPAMSLICGEFIKSLLTPAESSTRHSETTSSENQPTLSNGSMNGNGLRHDGSDLDEEMEDATTTAVRKTLLQQNTNIAKLHDSKQQQETLDTKLERMAALSVSLDF